MHSKVEHINTAFNKWNIHDAENLWNAPSDESSSPLNTWMLLKDFRYDIVTAIRYTLHEGETLSAPSLHLQLSITFPQHLHVSLCLSLTLPYYPQIYRHCLHVVKQGQWRSVCWLSITCLTKHCVSPGNKQSGCRRLSGQIIHGPVSHPEFQRWVWYLVASWVL